MKVRYFHIRPSYTNGGATVSVAEGPFAHEVTVRVAYCHSFSYSDWKKPANERKGDRFSKKEGRSKAEQAPARFIALRDLPRVLQEVEREVCRRIGSPLLVPNDYSFALRYFIPLPVRHAFTAAEINNNTADLMSVGTIFREVSPTSKEQ